ncbi:hypothetical protein OA57_00345 [Chelonobacter oris]|uniref:DUF4153 domain-containing protein n=1 Tax=Chelonobacter oris TaxID=505317 RepID=A0A0A3AQC3_9PAST|nr:DUF4153 domain-containing protein [Chelonobacter oris]KGQ71556.1 hypothetical protein OA57_00345 [Chelonobacter oris]
MLKLKIYFVDLAAQSKLLMKNYPLEMIWIALFSLPFLYIDLIRLTDQGGIKYWCFAPAFLVVSYLLRRRRIAYWLTAFLPPLVLFWQMNNGLEVDNYLIDRRFWALQLLLLLGLSADGWQRENRTFIAGFLQTMLNICRALVSTVICLALLSALLASVEFLFSLDLPFDQIWRHIAPFALCSVFPLFFLLFQQKNNCENSELNSAGQLLNNVVFSPVLIIYSIILYLYTLKIILLGELPQGRISYIILPYLLVGLALKGLQLLQESPKWQGFYRFFGWIALLPLALLWMAVYQRLSHYGLTEVRIYLLTIVILTTLFIALSLFEFSTQYRTFAGLLAVAIILLGWVLNPAQMAFDNQSARFDRQLRQWDLLDQKGKIKPLPDAAAQADFSEQQKTAYRRLSEQAASLYWQSENRGLSVETHYGQHLSRLIARDEPKPPETEPFERITLSDDQTTAIPLTHRYRTLLSLDRHLDGGTAGERRHRFKFEEPGITAFDVDLNNVINDILLKNGFKLNTKYRYQDLKPLSNQFLIVEGQNFLLKFSSFSLRYDDELGYVFEYAVLELILQ